jgi:hypothetical protein
VSFRYVQLRGDYAAGDDRVGGFYVPLLKQAVAYDRVSGYFRSSSLRATATGLSHFIGRGGTMRLICGAELDEVDLRAIEEGQPLSDVVAGRLLADPLEGADIVTEHRLETLAWLVREGRLIIKVGVPTDHLGRPLRRDETDRYFHSKYGVFTDSDGNRVAFLGSDNESSGGQVRNHETFSVYPSWLHEVWEWNGKGVCERFEDHWYGRPDKGWAVIDLPDAVSERLVARVKTKTAPPPARDPEEEAPAGSETSDAVRLAFLAAAPTLDGGTGVGLATAGVEPWPHQTAIAWRAVSTYPRSYLLADEVGLGKTIEAGLILRELLVSGKAQTALLLVPASVLRQWQEELDEKFSLRLPRLERGAFWTRDDEEIPAPSGSPWRAFPVVLASSHLARRRDRRDQLLTSGPWDVVLVDEAHHARRRGSKPTDPPNTLLSLLQAMKASGSWKALYLASATPMQMNAHEAWDLLELLGLTGRWAQSAEPFVRFYSELRQPFHTRPWGFFERMEADFFADPAVQPDPVLTEQVRGALGLAGSAFVRRFHDYGLTHDAAVEMEPARREWMDEWLRTHTPMHDRVFRTTRSVLRHYKERGLLAADATIPFRHVVDRFIPMTPAETTLYERIETYISRYYDAYLTGPASQKPLGFIMTVYRRRLTSSFQAIERSLRRRRDVLLGRASTEALLDPDDLAALEYSTLFDIGDLPAAQQNLAAEAEELADFLTELAKRPPDESKMTYLHGELEDAFTGGHDTAVVFTQYTDTMDYVRDQLLPWYGTRVVCYSGRGGERWDTETEKWRPLPKADVKRLFREGRDVKILIGTDSLSEGLNLQTCGKLVNYDMPWNFMRVEQRIGRVDRIGGRPTVDVSNYFYKGTVEEQIYHGISEDFDWFTDIVGPAQPVLGQVEQAIEGVAMHAPGAERDQYVAERVEDIRKAIDEARARPVTLDDVGQSPRLGQSAAPAVDLPGLERVLLSASATSRFFHPHPSVPGAYLLDVGASKTQVTVRRTVLDEHAPDVRLLTYGPDSLLDQLLAAAGVTTNMGAEFLVDGAPVHRLDELEARLADSGPARTIAEQVGELPLGDKL